MHATCFVNAGCGMDWERVTILADLLGRDGVLGPTTARDAAMHHAAFDEAKQSVIRTIAGIFNAGAAAAVRQLSAYVEVNVRSKRGLAVESNTAGNVSMRQTAPV